MTNQEDKWKDKLSAEQYRVLREKGTEPAFSGKFVNHHENGDYVCAACGKTLFSSHTKFDSDSGWPSFSEPANLEHVHLSEDTSHGMTRTEVTCANCAGHLGHMFADGPSDKGGMRYCINSLSLDFKPKN